MEKNSNVASSVENLLDELNDAKYESELWFDILRKIRDLGEQAIPILVDVIEDPDWNRPTHT